MIPILLNMRELLVENYKKWGVDDLTPIEQVIERLDSLEDRVKVLEEENIELTNELYRLENSLDARIDILSENKLNYFNLGDK
jgi:chaperonin cofactor prefoldin